MCNVYTSAYGWDHCVTPWRNLPPITGQVQRMWAWGHSILCIIISHFVWSITKKGDIFKTRLTTVNDMIPRNRRHNSDVKMGAMAYQITSLTIVYSAIYSYAESKDTSKLCITGLWEGNSLMPGEIPAQRSSNVENVSIWWHHRGSKGRVIRTSPFRPLLLFIWGSRFFFNAGNVLTQAQRSNCLLEINFVTWGPFH